MNESYCRCPGCGECRAHANEPKLKAEIKRLKAQREWVGLTEDELQSILQQVSGQGWKTMLEAIEAKLKEKNQ